MIKVDLHMHTGEDPYDGLPFTAVELIDRAAELRFDAIAITLHDRVTEDERLFAHARRRGVLLIRACEWTIQRVDVLLYNVTQQEVEGLRTFEDLRRFKRAKGEELLVIAPHPYYPIGHSLRGRLMEHLDLFDAIEYASLHLPWLNFNRRALAVAARHGKPVVANSDAHALWMFGRHFTWVDAPAEVPAIFRAIKAGRVRWESPPVTLWECARMFVVDPLWHRKAGRVRKSFPD